MFLLAFSVRKCQIESELYDAIKAKLKLNPAPDWNRSQIENESQVPHEIYKNRSKHLDLRCESFL